MLTFSAPQAQSGACSAVFNTAELLEQILLDVPCHQLFALKRVCRRWNVIFSGPTPLRVAMFLSPAPGKAFAEIPYKDESFTLPIREGDPRQSPTPMELKAKLRKLRRGHVILFPHLRHILDGVGKTGMGPLKKLKDAFFLTQPPSTSVKVLIGTYSKSIEPSHTVNFTVPLPEGGEGEALTTWQDQLKWSNEVQDDAGKEMGDGWALHGNPSHETGPRLGACAEFKLEDQGGVKIAAVLQAWDRFWTALGGIDTSWAVRFELSRGPEEESEQAPWEGSEVESEEEFGSSFRDALLELLEEAFGEQAEEGSVEE